MFKVLLAVILVVGAQAASAQTVRIHNGFGTGEDYLKMSILEQRAYAMGVVNGMLVAPLFGAPKQQMLRLENCLLEMTDSQVAAILRKYLQDNPGRWHETPHVPMYAALMNSCPR